MSYVAEQWKLINGYFDYYISSLGRVFSLKTYEFLKLNINKQTGYQFITLRRNRKKRYHEIHRLVALAFLTNPEQKRCVDHINNIKTDNRVENLRFATHFENGGNRKPNKNSLTQTKGVYFKKSSQKYHAYIRVGGVQMHLGVFKTFEEAKRERTRVANKLFGDYTNACEKL